MGSICSRSKKSTAGGVAIDNGVNESSRHANGHSNNESRVGHQSHGLPGKIDSNSTLPPVDDDMDRQVRESFSFPEMGKVSYGPSADDINDGIPHLSRALSHKSRSTKSKQAAVTKVFSLHVFDLCIPYVSHIAVALYCILPINMSSYRFCYQLNIPFF